jgi:putative membrane protein (TIGR04086 family)
MKARLNEVHWDEVHWDLVIWTAAVLYIVTFVLGLLVSLLWLAFLSGIHASSDTAELAFSWFSALLVIVVTGYGAWRAARRVDREAILHGFLVGLLVALISFLLDFLFTRQVQLMSLLVYALMVAAGELGGILASRRG